MTISFGAVTAADLNLAWCRAFIDELTRAGLRHICISPGSRSSPLTLAVAERADVSTSVHIDERSAAFFALGYGRATGLPAALICTSGTAAANYFPAIIEAHYSRVPLVILTADRPPELRDTGAWQAIDQLKLYGGYVRWFAEVATPQDEPALWRTVRSLAARAVAVARSSPAGPVHLNFPFREPLIPPIADRPATSAAPSGGPATPTEPVRDPYVTLVEPLRGLAAGEAAAIAEDLQGSPRGLILAGQINPLPGYADAVARLAEATGYPVLAEATGGLRYGPHDASRVVTGYDAVLRAADWVDAHAPDVVLRLGASFTWKVVAEFLERQPPRRQLIVDPQLTWDDPTRGPARRLAVDPVAFCDDVAAALRAARPAGPAGTAQSRAWLDDWRQAAAIAAGELAALVGQAPDTTVAWVYVALIEHLPPGALVYAANSMAVRDLDSFTRPSAKPLRAIANRGAAGIDGTLSSALGAAFGTGTPAVLVTGDLAFLHDLNGLGAAGLPGVNLTVLLFNDGGGGIFAHLPIAELDPPIFERYVLTPSGVDFAAACAAFGVPHRRAGDRDAFGRSLTELLATPGVHVIELAIDRQANTAAHRHYWSAVASRIR